MPPATIFQVDSESGERKPLTSYSYKVGETFDNARRNLESGFDFEFNFIDVNLCSRMMEKFEKHNLVEDCGGKIVIIPKFPRDALHGNLQNVGSQHAIGSSNASNGPSSIFSDDHVGSPALDFPIDQPDAAPSEEDDPSVRFT